MHRFALSVLCSLALLACGDDDDSPGDKAGSAGSGANQSGAGGVAGAGAGGAAGDGGVAGDGGAAGEAGSGGAASPPCVTAAACTYHECSCDGGGPCSTPECDFECTTDTPLCEGVAFPGDTIYSKADLACALEALRDGKPGLIEWVHSPETGVGNYYWSLHVGNDRLAVLSYRGVFYSGSQRDYSLDGPGQLQPREYFEDCLKKTDVQELRLCLSGAIVGCAPAQE